MQRKTPKFYLPFVILLWTLALQHGRAREVVVADGTLVSSVSLGTMTPHTGSCPSQTGVSTSQDTRSYPANGSYQCPNGNRGNLAATPNPLVASCDVPCLDGQQLCGSSFTDPTYASDTIGPFASVTSTTKVNPGPPPNGCTAGTTRTFKSYTDNVYDNSALCTYDPGGANGDPCQQPSDCSSNYCDELEDAPWVCADSPTPILIDFAQGSINIHLTDSAHGVLFDLNGDGLRERVAWTRANEQVGFLALDRNHDGSINDGRELFGNATILTNGRRATNGFEALRELDDNKDGVIDASDSKFNSLRMWFDLNHDGVSQPDELYSMSAVAIMSISTVYRESRRTDQNGIQYPYQGSAVIGGRARPIFDVILR